MYRMQAEVVLINSLYGGYEKSILRSNQAPDLISDIKKTIRWVIKFELHMESKL